MAFPGNDQPHCRSRATASCGAARVCTAQRGRWTCSKGSVTLGKKGEKIDPARICERETEAVNTMALIRGLALPFSLAVLVGCSTASVRSPGCRTAGCIEPDLAQLASSEAVLAFTRCADGVSSSYRYRKVAPPGAWTVTTPLRPSPCLDRDRP
jgi:hypothetical protein